MSENPTVWNRMVARLQGEVPADTLEAYRRANLQVFEMMDQVEAGRAACAAQGLDPWSVPRATRAEFLCAWNAYVLQTLGNDILDADYAAEPVTVGYVPPVTADQVLRFFSQVEGWMNRAQQAHANPDYVLDVQVPAELPSWSRVRPCPTSHMQGIMHAMRAVADHASAAMGFLPERAPGGPEQQAQLNLVRQLYAAAQSKARYATELHGVNPSRDLYERVDPHVRGAIELFYRVGQLIADPALATGAAAAPHVALPAPAPVSVTAAAPPAEAAGATLSAPLPGVLPGDPRFDPWCLSDPDAREAMKHESKARRALRKMWDLDPDPARTLALYEEIRAAFQRGDVDYALGGGGRVGYYHRCPWGPVLVAIRNMKLGGTRVETMQQFVYEVGALNRAEKFRRRIVTGTFQPTTEVAYGPPRS